MNIIRKRSKSKFHASLDHGSRLVRTILVFGDSAPTSKSSYLAFTKKNLDDKERIDGKSCLFIVWFVSCFILY